MKTHWRKVPKKGGKTRNVSFAFTPTYFLVKTKKIFFSPISKKKNYIFYVGWYTPTYLKLTVLVVFPF